MWRKSWIFSERKQSGASRWSAFPSPKGRAEMAQTLSIHYASTGYESVQSQSELINVHHKKSVDLHMEV